MISRDFEITNSSGIKLACTIDLPDSGVAAYFLIFSHCFTCTKELKAIANIHSSFTGNNFGCIRFDFSGIGKSGGNFTETNFSLYVKDILDVYDYLKINFKSPSVLIGHSFGGCVVLEASKYLNSVKAIAIIGTPVEPMGLSKKLSKTRDKAFKNGKSISEIGGVKYTFSKQFFEDIESYSVTESIKKLGKPLLILHSPADGYTDIENASKIFSSAKHPKSFISLDNIDHLMLNREDAVWVGNLIYTWSKRYVVS